MKNIPKRTSNAKGPIPTFRIILRSAIIEPNNINIYSLKHFQSVIFKQIILSILVKKVLV